MLKKQKSAFTLIEMSIVIVLLGIIGFFSIDFLIDTASKTAVANTGKDIVQFFQKVQNYNIVYGIPGITEGNQTYYGIGFERDTDNQSFYYSFKKTSSSKQILETFYLPNNVYFSNFNLGENLELRFCADIDYNLQIDPNSNVGGMEYLCDDDGLVCSELFEIDVKSKFNDYEKKVFVNTSKTQYSCKPKIYIKEEAETSDLCISAVGCINGIIYNNICDFEGEVVDICYSFTDLGNNTCECN
jgi:prepilin-type N-terminal cleavage/methylation domain-containing protein